MTMQRKVTMSDRVETDRVLHALARQDRKTRMAESNLVAASAFLVEQWPESARWFCLQLMTGHEYDVEKYLSGNVEIFLPRERVVVVRKGKKLESDRPFFPGYLLVRCVPSPAAFHGLKQVKHVLDIVGGPSGYHIVKDNDVNVFKQLSTAAEAPRVATDKTMKDGDRADITAGPFAGFSCVVIAVRWCRQARARVRIDVQGKPFDIESMPLAFLQKL